MRSFLAWFAFSEAERRRVLDLVHSLEERDIRDELGIGTVRDSLADMLFPGISIIQTRARYFLFIPWIYRKLEQKKVSSAEIATVARDQEIKLIDALCDNLGENKGIIGYRAKSELRRLPSEIYWQGLGVWGIRQFNGGRNAYHRSLDRYYMDAGRKLTAEETAADVTVRNRNWHDLPTPPANFPREADFELTVDEAEYLSRRILQGSRTRNSFLATLIARRQVWEPEIEYPWLSPVFEWATDKQQDQLKHAETFSLLMLGAALLYNLILCQLRNADSQTKKDSGDEDSDKEYFQSELASWLIEIEKFRPQLKSWDRKTFWTLVAEEGQAADALTLKFCEDWFDIAINCKDAAQLMNANEAAYRLIVMREKDLKGPLSRTTNQQTLKQWGGESGAFRLSFRWPKARVIIRDIVGGLNR